MRAEYDSEANAISIDLLRVDQWDEGHHPHARGNVALSGGEVANVELLYPDLGIDEPLDAVALHYGLDAQALKAAARSALEVPDRLVELEVGARASA